MPWILFFLKFFCFFNLKGKVRERERERERRWGDIQTERPPTCWFTRLDGCNSRGWDRPKLGIGRKLKLLCHNAGPSLVFFCSMLLWLFRVVIGTAWIFGLFFLVLWRKFSRHFEKDSTKLLWAVYSSQQYRCFPTHCHIEYRILSHLLCPLHFFNQYFKFGDLLLLWLNLFLMF